MYKLNIVFGARKFHGCTRREPTWAHLWPKGLVIVASSIISRILIQAPSWARRVPAYFPVEKIHREEFLGGLKRNGIDDA